MNEFQIPMNMEAEAKMLGAMILDPAGTIHRIRASLHFSDLRVEGNQLIYKTILDLVDKGGIPDEIAICDSLGEAGIRKAGGAAYITSLANQVSTSANAVNHAGIILSKSRARSLMQSCQKAQKDIAEGMDPDQVMHLLRRGLDDVQHRGVHRNLIEIMQDVGEQEIERLIKLYNEGGAKAAQGLTIGIDMLNHGMNGFQEKTFTIVGARPGVGKTHWINYMLGCSMMAGNKVGLISVDMAKEVLLPYLIPTLATLGGEIRTKYDIYKPKSWDEFDQSKLRDVATAIDINRNFALIADPPSKSMGAINSYVGDLARAGHKVIAIDQFQNIRDVEDALEAQNRGALEKLVGDVVSMARDYSISLILLHQIGRSGAERPTKKDLKHTGAMEEKADNIILLHDPQLALKETYGGWVQGENPWHYRKARENSQEIPNTDLTNPRWISVDLCKTRSSGVRQVMIPFDYRYGVKVRWDEDSGQFMDPEPVEGVNYEAE